MTRLRWWLFGLGCGALVVGACGGSGPSGSAPDQVWVMNVEVAGESGNWRQDAPISGETATGTADFVVTAAACHPSLMDRSETGDGYGYTGCQIARDELAAQVEGLTATATVDLWLELDDVRTDVRIDQVAHLGTHYVGPLEMGDSESLPSLPVTFELGLLPPGEDLSQADEPLFYRVHAYVSACTLSNGTPCGDSTKWIKYDLVPEGETGYSAREDEEEELAGTIFERFPDRSTWEFVVTVTKAAPYCDSEIGAEYSRRILIDV